MPISISLTGGIGNNMFQIGAVLGYSLKHGIDYCIPNTIVNPHQSDPVQYKFPGIKYCDDKMKGDILTHCELSFSYTEIPKYDFEDILLIGYFQSFKYLNGYREEILKAFGFDGIETIPDTCSLHFRSGDFKQFSDFHPIITREYVALALGNMWFRGIKKFIVFSDDIPEIKQMINTFGWFKDLDFEYSEGRSAIEDLRLMASCSSQICANSTFSSWAAYINPNPNKIVIQPKKWFGESVKHDTSDLYLPNSLIL